MKKGIYIFIFFYFILSNNVEGQVTIGTDKAPVAGSLLDLKQTDSIGRNSDKGLGLPRVALIDVNDLAPCVTNATSNEKVEHTGLTVYNTTDNSTTSSTLKEGVYFWDSNTWQPIGIRDAQGYGPWYQVGVTPAIPSRNVDTDSYLNAKAVIGGSTVINDATLSVYGNNYIKGNQQIIGKLGINKDSVETNLDVAGSVAFRDLPTHDDGLFTDIGVDVNGVIHKKNELFTSYSVYLGFDPMAKTHRDTIPLNLEDGYMYKIEGMSIGACYGVLISFTMTFSGTRYLGATLQASSTLGNNTKYSPVVLSATDAFFGKYLETLAGAGVCGDGLGHQIYLSGRDLIVIFTDIVTYYKDAGTFAITNITRVKVVPNS